MTAPKSARRVSVDVVTAWVFAFVALVNTAAAVGAAITAGDIAAGADAAYAATACAAVAFACRAEHRIDRLTARVKALETSERDRS